MNLLWIVLFVKPVFMILLPYTELKTNTLSWLREYLKTIRGRSLKWLRYMVLSIVYFIATLGMKWRRLLGITTFLLLFTHGGINVGHRLHDSYTLASQLNAFWILTWYISLACLLIGYITSNDFSIRLFKMYWKPIQSLAYVALIFGILHIAFLDFAEYGWYIVLLVIYIVSKLIEKKKITIHWERLFTKKEDVSLEAPQKDSV
jgi:DMSO/TMAO reductase YedYZ heme-binding membrane subunit